MRKRVVIGLLSLLVIGVVGIFVLQPRKGSVEWHEKEYLAAANRLAENRFVDRLKRTFYRAMGNAPPGGLPAARESRDMVRMEEHRKALVEIGYLAEKQFALKYRAVDQIKVGLAQTSIKPPGVVNGRFWMSTKRDTIVATAPQQVIGQLLVSEKKNTIVVTARPAVMADYEEQIRKADAP